MYRVCPQVVAPSIVFGLVTVSTKQMQKTTIAGILSAAAVIIGEVADMLDSSTTTVFQPDLVFSSLVIMFGFIAAKDARPR